MSDKMNSNNLEQQSLHPLVLMEEEVLNFWDRIKAFEKTIERESLHGDYVFYDGPPFGTGEPHYGHILSSVSKDVVPRYWTMRGYRVMRRWGWDCHGLPIENIIEKDFKVSGKKQIEEMGIDKFNETCRVRVLEYANLWDSMVRRIGRWVDFQNSYKTMDLGFMESVWWGFKEMWKKDLIYQGRKVLLYCPRCETPISNFEVAMDNSYKDIEDETIYIKFELTNSKEILNLDGKVFMLAWTTTPWTLPGNVALAVGQDIDYSVVSVGEETYILAKERVEHIFNNQEIKIIKEIKGKDLLNLEYIPLFNVSWPEEEKSKKAYYVVAGDFVTTETGAGIVHISPVYGEDDYELAKKLALPIIPLLDEKGLVTQALPEFTGLYFAKVNGLIINKLTANGLILKSVKVVHSYPFCHRCDTKLFYNAIPAWFLNINKIKERMLEHNRNINWYPPHLKEGRFAKGIEQAPDWNISRNRYFATPIPIWRCEDCGELEAIGSVQELKDKSGADNILDIHNHSIDHLTWQCSKCSNTMKRISEVFDCWVESGSMPFAQLHYPFENQKRFEENFPAQFISEYISQTRAWFYVMHAISTSLFDSHSFDNVVATGVIMASDGQKMSKSKKNFPDPSKIINQFGADSLRLYLMGSPVMKAENLFFNEAEVKDLFRNNITTLWNVFKFYNLYALENNFQARDNFDLAKASDNILDQWMLAKLNILIQEMTDSMDGYNLPNSIRLLGVFINELSTWYLRRSRDRFKSNNEIDKKYALATSAYVLSEFTKVAAPFTPFIAEYIWQEVNGYSFKTDKSVHLEMWSKASDVNEEVINSMDVVKRIVEAGLKRRSEVNIKIRQPLPFYSTDLVKELPLNYQEIIKDELNVMELIFGDDEIGIEITPSLLKEGIKREIVRSINAMRKNASLTIQDTIGVYWHVADLKQSLVAEVFTDLNNEIAQDVLASLIENKRISDVNIEKEFKINNEEIWLGVKKSN